MRQNAISRILRAVYALLIVITLSGCSGILKKKDTSPPACAEAVFPHVRLELVDWFEGPVIGKGDPGTEDIKHGLEGGSVIRVDNVYHLFTSEQYNDPKWVKMRLGHWTSTDGENWIRAATLYESSGDYTGTDRRAALWSPMPVFDQQQDNWYITYVAYSCKPDTKEQFLNNFNGQIWMAKSDVPGLEGIGGPYTDIGVMIEPGKDSQEWEGLQGTDSFFPFKTDDVWMAFYGSAKTEKLPIQFWGVGLAGSEKLQGPWKRIDQGNPVDLKVNFAENPIVTKIGDSVYIAVMDALVDGFGYSCSYDGLNWSEMHYVNVSEKMNPWWSEFRTPLCLIREDNGYFSVFFTAAKEKTDYWQHMGEHGYVLDTGFDSMGWLKVKLVSN